MDVAGCPKKLVAVGCSWTIGGLGVVLVGDWDKGSFGAGLWWNIGFAAKIEELLRLKGLLAGCCRGDG